MLHMILFVTPDTEDRLTKLRLPMVPMATDRVTKLKLHMVLFITPESDRLTKLRRPMVLMATDSYKAEDAQGRLHNSDHSQSYKDKAVQITPKI